LFFIGIIIVILGLLFSTFNKDLQHQPVITSQAHTALIDIKGEIGSEHDANSDNIRSSLKTAFDNKHVKGIILRINSPGGSPVQARYVYDDIRWFRTNHPNIKVYAVIEDIGASAGYLIASAADAVYADETSLVGSIGVKLDSFGFVDAMHKLGVERRLYTSGKFKGALDPFSPKNPEEEIFINQQLKIVHDAFIKNVQEGRGNRLKDNADIFTGQFWTGKDAFELGLIDGFGDAYFVAREVIKAEEILDYTASTNIIDRLANKLGASISETMLKVKLH
jgi:protease IV